MDGLNITNFCRICLGEGANVPIFERSCTEDDVYNKMIFCLHCDKIEDIEGFPRHICLPCNKNLVTLCNFINKYKESSKILEDGSKIVKKEINDSDDVYIDEITKAEEVLKEIQVESDGLDDTEDEKPLNIFKKTQRKLVQTVSRAQQNKTKHGYGTNKIASSILRDKFLWTEKNWCVKTVITKKISKARPKKTIKLPNVNATSEQKLCDLCGKIFENKDKLRSHKRNVHFNNPVKCPKCSRVCASGYYLKKHMKRIHESSRDFICSTCGRGFTYKKELTQHFTNVHDKKLKPKKKYSYSCKFCDKKYQNNKNVIIHERSAHTGERPAQCSVCDSSLYHEDYLRDHMRLHTGEAPFKCPICGRGHAQICNMKSHLRIHRLSELGAVTLSKIRPSYLKILKV